MELRYIQLVLIMLFALSGDISLAAEHQKDNHAEKIYRLDIPKQPIEEALNALSRLTGNQLLFSYDLIETLHSNPVKGEFTLESALAEMLRGTGLSGGLTKSGAIVITPLKKTAELERGELNMKQLPKKSLLASVVALLFSSAPQQVLAQGETSDMEKRAGHLEEVIVTARKRAEDMQSVPISVTAFSAEKMEIQSMANLRDVARFAPSLVVSNTGGAPNQAAIFIRGVGEPEQFATSDPAVGVYVDGVYHGRAQGSLMDLLDLERVEVLRGPQGTLFGRNTIGGAINLVSVAPTGESAAKISMAFGNHERFELGASLNGALIDDTLFARLSVKHTERDCLARTVNLNACMGGIETDAARLGLRWLASDSVTVDITADYTDDNSYLMPTSLTRADASELGAVLHNSLVASGALGPDAVPFTGNEPAAGTDPYVTEMQVTTDAPLDVFGASLKVAWEINEQLDLIAISAYRDLEQSYSFDPDLTQADISAIITDTESSQFSQEVRLEGTSFNGRLNWISGLYYFEESFEYLEEGHIPVFIFFGIPSDQARFPAQDMESIAAFGHFSYSLTETLKLVGGLRYNQDEKDIHFRVTDLSIDAMGEYSLLDHKDSESWTEFSPKIGLDYHLGEDVLVYASVSRGYRSGGYNGRAFNLDEAQPYDPETLTSYEIGIKSQFLDNKLRFNAATYFSDYKDRQVLFFKVDPTTGSNSQFIENAATAQVAGVEVEVAALVGRGLTLEANLGYMDAEITEADPDSSITKDSAYSYAPDWTVALAADYRFPLSFGEMRFRVDYNYRSRVEFFPAATNFTFQNGFGLWNARLAYTSDNDKWNIALWGKNLTDEIYCLQCGDLPGFGFANGNFSEGREYGLTASYNFF